MNLVTGRKKMGRPVERTAQRILAVPSRDQAKCVRQMNFEHFRIFTANAKRFCTSEPADALFDDGRY
jgi:hypothetical protein